MDGDASPLRKISSYSSESPTFDRDGSFHVDEAVGSASISPSGRDVVLASRQGLHIIDLDNPFSPPRHLIHRTSWEVADVQWSPFAVRDYWVVSTSNQKALVWNLNHSTTVPCIEHVLHAHTRAITDINFSAHNPDMLATCAVDSFIHCWDLRNATVPALTFADWFSGATQVKWNRQNSHILASSHDRFLHIWDDRKGTLPLRTIDAHATKIYGIDWNRFEADQILTCSLDKTIKIWNYPTPEDTPKRVFNVDYPVWRARYTPFGWGILVMPQRGNYNLHMYDRRSAQPAGLDFPVKSFTGHQDQVKEFLWRARGNIEDGKDKRNFQLVSWGTDKNLLLHRIDDNSAERVGFQKGQAADPRARITREGAAYKTYHLGDEVSKSETDNVMQFPQGLGGMIREANNVGMGKVPMPLMRWGDPASRTTRYGLRPSDRARRDANPINWMKGVKIFRSDETAVGGRNSPMQAKPAEPGFDSHETLGDEITYVGNKYKKVSFENINVRGRSLQLQLNGPWGTDNSFVHLKAIAKFPENYPDHQPASFVVEKTSSIPDSSMKRLTFAVRTICETYVTIGQGSLEAVVCFLLGDRSLEESLTWIADAVEAMQFSGSRKTDDSSSDEDDILGDVLPRNDEIDANNVPVDVLMASNANANVPLPKACGACWAKDGRLVCFFPAKIANEAVGTLATSIQNPGKTLSNAFDSFGRLPQRPEIRYKGRMLSNDSETDDSSASESSDGTSQTSDSSLEFTNKLDIRYGPSASPWRRSGPRPVTGRSHPSSALTLPSARQNSPVTTVSIKSITLVTPHSRSMAAKLISHGDKVQICHHNAAIAMEFGRSDIADAWVLLSIVLFNQVPLEAVPTPDQASDVFVLAKRALVHIRRKHTGMDLAFDEPDAVSFPKYLGQIKWGYHPLARGWLIRELLTHFEEKGDLQTLALLSCVLTTPSSRNARHSYQPPDKGDVSATDLLPSKASGGVPYFPSFDVAWSFHGKLQHSLTQITSKVSQPLKRAESGLSGVYGSDMSDSDRTAALSNDTTPPMLTRQNSHTSSLGQSLASSPEHQFKRSNSLISATLTSSLSRPFSFITSSSPPGQPKVMDLSISAPSSAPPIAGGITWGKNRIYRENGTSKWMDVSSAAVDDLGLSTRRAFDQTVDDKDPEISISIMNQDQFDDEGCVDLPLLGLSYQLRSQVYCNSYANVLYTWELHIKRCEVLKFNSRAQLTTARVVSPHDQRLCMTHNVPENNTRESEEINDDTRGLEVGAICVKCQECVVRTWQSSPGTRSSCSNCATVTRKLQCAMCYEAICTLYKACLHCGHVSHLACFEKWSNEAQGEEEIDCEAGCGCACLEESVMSIHDLDGDDVSILEDALPPIVQADHRFAALWPP